MFFIQMMVLMMTAIATMVKLKNRYLHSSEVEPGHNYQYQAKLSMQKELKELSRARLHNYHILHISFLFTKIFPLLFTINKIVRLAQPESERTDCEPRVPGNQHSEAVHQQPGRIGDRSYISGERMLIDI